LRKSGDATGVMCECVGGGEHGIDMCE
jgi:hypothetical protein